MHTVPHARIATRIFPTLWQSPQRTEELLVLFARYREAIDEVVFFSAGTHIPLPEEVLYRKAEDLSRLIPRIHDLGLAAGIDHLATMGHIDEHLEHALPVPWQQLMDAHGVMEIGHFCPADPQFREYTARVYTAFAQTGADYIWMDDDIRLEGRYSADHACFCDRCLARFAGETSRAWTRETLLTAFNTGALDERLAVRAQWLAHNRHLLAEFLAGIRATVDAVNPALPLVFMTGEVFYTGNAVDDLAAALIGSNHAPMGFRPSGGFYHDAMPAECLEKAHALGRMTAQLPLSVTDIQSEVENFHYQHLKKSKTAFMAEIAAYIGAGCTGAAFDCLGLAGNPFDDNVPYFDAVAARRGFFDRLVATFGRSRCEGIWLGVTRDHYVTQQVEGDWMTAPAWMNAGPINELSEIGLPMTYAADGSALTLLVGDACLGFSREALLQCLAGGVLLDGCALQRLHELGLGELTGFAVAETRERDTVEILTADAINGPYAGWRRDGRQSFFRGNTAYLLTPLTPNARVLSEAVDYAGNALGPLSGVFENRLGGRIAVRGYYPWTMVQWQYASEQMKSLCRWLSRDTLLAYLASYHKAALWCRRDEAGNPALLLLNASLDAQADIDLRLRGRWERLTCTRSDNTSLPLDPVGTDGVYTRFRLPEISCWDAVLLTIL